jgi:DNA-binding LacI/PurR family transcriptional regulator
MLQRKNLVEQTVLYLIRELQGGRWSHQLPGVDRLARELEISREVVRKAILELEHRNLLVSRGLGRARIYQPRAHEETEKRAMRVMILLYERMESDSGNTQKLLLMLRHRLEMSGHHAQFSLKSQRDLGLSLARITRYVESMDVDAWVVMGGSKELLQWFSTYRIPAIAVGGRLKGLPIAGASRNPLTAFRQVFRDLISLGHRRIVILSPSVRRKPTLSLIESSLCEEMEAAGIPFGDYNIPEWSSDPEGLEGMLQKLFLVTPPTAIQISEPNAVITVLAFLARHSLRVPDDVTVIAEIMDNTLSWHRPRIAHYTVDYPFIVRRVDRWVNNVGLGVADLRQAASVASFDRGESVAGPKKTS